MTLIRGTTPCPVSSNTGISRSSRLDPPSYQNDALASSEIRITRHLNFRKRWPGHLWQGRFASYVLDEPHLLAAARYVEISPVKAGLVRRPWPCRWSSAAAHQNAREDGLVYYAEPLLELVGDWGKFLSQPVEPRGVEKLQAHERTGRPLGNDAFVAKLQGRLHRLLRPRKPGRKPKEMENRSKK